MAGAGGHALRHRTREIEIIGRFFRTGSCMRYAAANSGQILLECFLDMVAGMVGP
jgi:hypothetical protein